MMQTAMSAHATARLSRHHASAITARETVIALRITAGHHSATHHLIGYACDLLPIDINGSSCEGNLTVKVEG